MFIILYPLCITSTRCTRGVCAIAEGDNRRWQQASLLPSVSSRALPRVSIFTLMKPMKLCIILMGPWQKCRRHRCRRRGRKLHFSATLKWGRRQLMSNALNEFWELPPFSLAGFPVQHDTRKKQIIIKSLHFMGAFPKCNLHTIFYEYFTHMKTEITNLYGHQREEKNMCLKLLERGNFWLDIIQVRRVIDSIQLKE